jgi:hypothetical protein
MTGWYVYDQGDQSFRGLHGWDYRGLQGPPFATHKVATLYRLKFITDREDSFWAQRFVVISAEEARAIDAARGI